MFDKTGSTFEPCTSGEFQRKLERYDGESTHEKIGSAIDEAWPAPGYREHQRETVIDLIEQLYVDDKDVILLNSPTGSGKSLLLYAATAVVNNVVGRKSFTTSPQNVLVDQVDNDEFLEDVITLKGQNNYNCVHPKDKGTSVDSAICQRQDDFDCQFKDVPHNRGGCPYYGKKKIAKEKPYMMTNISLLMANSLIPDVVDAGFEQRELLCLDECHSVDDFALMFVGFSVSENSVPIEWDMVDLPDESASMDRVVEWLSEDLMAHVVEQINDLESQRDSITFTSRQQDQLDELRRFQQRVSNFLGDVEDHHWTRTHDSYGGSEKIEFEPVFVGRFLDDYLWSQAHKVVCASATIPPNFVEEVGLDDRDVGRIDVPSTFPPERRPIITTESVGKMTQKERDKTIPKMADQIARICNLWEGHSVIAHANSYKIAERLYDRLPQNVQRRTRLQDGDRREASLEDWVDAPVDEEGPYRDTGGQLFLSVAQEEGISLDDDQARVGIVAKCSYPYLGDERISYRVNELGDWEFYSAQAVTALQQSVGRTMRSKDDWSACYILDDSAVQLIERNEEMFESWFLDAVDCEFNEDVVSPENTPNDSTESESSLDRIADEYC
jgi:Rad3-related DNA helicase